jgi:membrane protein
VSRRAPKRYTGFARQRALSAAAKTSQLSNPVQRQFIWIKQHRWLSIPVLTAHRIVSHNIPTFAAAISFQAIISLFPLLAAITAGASFFIEPKILTQQILEAGRFIAPQSESLLEDVIRSVTRLRGQIGVVSLIGLLWTGSTLFSALRRGLNAATGAKRRRRFIHGRLFDLVVGLFTGLMLSLSIAVTAMLTVVQQLDISSPDSPVAALGVLIRTIVIVVPLVLSTAIFTVLFRVIPADSLPWPSAVLSGGLAAILFEVGKNLFVWYVATFSTFNAVYGPIATFVILLIWLYYSSTIVLSAAAFGAEMARASRHIDRHTAIDQPAMERIREP